MAPAVETEEEACLISKEVAHLLAVLAMRNNPMREDSLKVREWEEGWVRVDGGRGGTGRGASCVLYCCGTASGWEHKALIAEERRGTS